MGFLEIRYLMIQNLLPAEIFSLLLSLRTVTPGAPVTFKETFEANVLVTPKKAFSTKAGILSLLSE